MSVPSFSCVSKPILLRFKLVKAHCQCQVSLGLKEIQMGANDFKLNKVHIFARKPVIINVSRYAVPKQALKPTNRYNCDIK